MEITAFNESKELMDWITLDTRVHPELTRDVVVKRIKRAWIPEVALITPIDKGAQIGDTKARAASRKEKAEYRYKMFKLAQEVRYKHAAGIEIHEICSRYKLSKSQVSKMVSKCEWYNIHWEGFQDPLRVGPKGQPKSMWREEEDPDEKIELKESPSPNVGGGSTVPKTGVKRPKKGT